MSKENTQAPSNWIDENGVIRLRVRCESDGNGYPADAFFDDPKTQSIPARFVRGDTRKIAVLKGMLFDDRNRTAKNIHAEAQRRGFHVPSIEVARLIRMTLTDEHIQLMGLKAIVIMHNPIFGVSRSGTVFKVALNCQEEIRQFYWPETSWDKPYGFAFEAS